MQSRTRARQAMILASPMVRMHDDKVERISGGGEVEKKTYSYGAICTSEVVSVCLKLRCSRCPSSCPIGEQLARHNRRFATPCVELLHQCGWIRSHLLFQYPKFITGSQFACVHVYAVELQVQGHQGAAMRTRRLAGAGISQGFWIISRIIQLVADCHRGWELQTQRPVLEGKSTHWTTAVNNPLESCGACSSLVVPRRGCLARQSQSQTKARASQGVIGCKAGCISDQE